MSTLRSGKVAGSGGSLTVNVPADTPADAAVVVWLTHDDGGSTLSADAAGWTEEYNAGGQSKYACYTRTLSAAPPASYAFSAAGAGTGDFKAIIVTDDPDGGTIDAITNATGRSDAAAASATNAVDGVANPSTLLAFWGNDSSYTVSSAPADMTLLESDITGASSIYAYYQVNAGEGSLSKSLTFSGLDEWGNILILIDETAGAPGGAVLSIVSRIRIVTGTL